MQLCHMHCALIKYFTSMVHITIFAALSDYFVTIVAMRIMGCPWKLALEQFCVLGIKKSLDLGLGKFLCHWPWT